MFNLVKEVEMDKVQLSTFQTHELFVPLCFNIPFSD
jgi:hypothetical protein